jgi:hypothetical protein
MMSADSFRRAVATPAKIMRRHAGSRIAPQQSKRLLRLRGGQPQPVTDLGFRCRGAEHLLLLLDTRKTSFIAKNFRGK